MKLPKEIKLKKSHTAPIFHVDDDEALVSLVKRYHNKSKILNPYVSFNNGDDFLDFIKDLGVENKQLPLLVLLDINMPGKDGFEVLKELRNIPHFKDVPLCSMLSSSTYEFDIEKSKSLGADLYLVKPDNAREYQEFFEDISKYTSQTEQD